MTFLVLSKLGPSGKGKYTKSLDGGCSIEEIQEDVDYNKTKEYKQRIICLPPYSKES